MFADKFQLIGMIKNHKNSLGTKSNDSHVFRAFAVNVKDNTRLKIASISTRNLM